MIVAIFLWLVRCRRWVGMGMDGGGLSGDGIIRIFSSEVFVFFVFYQFYLSSFILWIILWEMMMMMMLVVAMTVILRLVKIYAGNYILAWTLAPSPTSSGDMRDTVAPNRWDAKDLPAAAAAGSSRECWRSAKCCHWTAGSCDNWEPQRKRFISISWQFSWLNCRFCWSDPKYW